MAGARAGPPRGARPPGSVRIIGGQWKRTPLAVPDITGLRPTPDRVRETLFNWLGQRLDDAAVLDLFAGSGALGLEAASRGARPVVLVESDRRAVAAIRATLERLHASQVEVFNGDALALLGSSALAASSFDLVFLDPPFGLGWLERVLPRLQRCLAPAARIYIENDQPVSAEFVADQLNRGLPEGGTPCAVQGLRADKAGQVHYHLFALG